MKCECGREHIERIEKIQIEHHIDKVILDDLKTYAKEEIIIVTDIPVSEAYVCLIHQLNEQGYTILKLKRNMEVLPDEQGVGEILLHTTDRTKLMVGIGSGTINDLCRYVSYRLDIPYWIVMSAPSMDGYASTASPILVQGFKKTYYCHVAKRIYGEKDVINQAPKEMVVAGLGDLLGKITALTDWKMSHIIHGEYFCPRIYKGMYAYIDALVQHLIISDEGLHYGGTTEQQLGEFISESLIQSGIYMYYVGNSRPASGAEHLISHTLEMKAIEEGRKVDFHGIKVGMATQDVLKLYQGLYEDMDKVQVHFQLTDQQVLELRHAINKALSYEKLVKDYQKLIVHIREKYSKDQIIYAMKQGPIIRERFTVLSVCKALGWEML